MVAAQICLTYIPDSKDPERQRIKTPKRVGAFLCLRHESTQTKGVSKLVGKHMDALTGHFPAPDTEWSFAGHFIPVFVPRQKQIFRSVAPRAGAVIFTSPAVR